MHMIGLRIPRLARPPYRIRRVSVRSIDEALAWLHTQPWPTADTDTDAKRRTIVKRLIWARRLRAWRRIVGGTDG